MSKMYVEVGIKSQYGYIEAINVDIAEIFTMAFEPLNTTDESIGLFVGEVFRSSPQAQAKLKLRDDAAKDISEAITKALIKQMSKYDKHNGYKL